MTDVGTWIYKEMTVGFKDSWKEVKDITRNFDKDKRKKKENRTGEVSV